MKKLRENVKKFKSMDSLDIKYWILVMTKALYPYFIALFIIFLFLLMLQ